LRESSAKIDELKAKADQAKAEAKIEYYEQIEALRSKQAVAPDDCWNNDAKLRSIILRKDLRCVFHVFSYCC